MTKRISCDCKCKCNSTTYSNQKYNNKTCQCECKSHHKYEKYYSWNPSTWICENSKYLKSIGDTSVIVYYEIISSGYCINKHDKYYSNPKFPISQPKFPTSPLLLCYISLLDMLI